MSGSWSRPRCQGAFDKTNTEGTEDSEGHRVTARKLTEAGYDDLTREIIGAAIEVHSQLGCGLLESVYENCMVKELRSRGFRVDQQVRLPIRYKGEVLDKEFVIDLLVAREIVVELKAVETVIPLHKSQLLSLLRLSGKHLGLLINFNVIRLKEGIHRVINGRISDERAKGPEPSRKLPTPP
jgi:GxxExxY protein